MAVQLYIVLFSTVSYLCILPTSPAVLAEKLAQEMQELERKTDLGSGSDAGSSKEAPIHGEHDPANEVGSGDSGTKHPSGEDQVGAAVGIEPEAPEPSFPGSPASDALGCALDDGYGDPDLICPSPPSSRQSPLDRFDDDVLAMMLGAHLGETDKVSSHVSLQTMQTAVPIFWNLTSTKAQFHFSQKYELIFVLFFLKSV